MGACFASFKLVSTPWFPPPVLGVLERGWSCPHVRCHIVGYTHLEIEAILGWTPRVPGSWPIHSWSPWRSGLTDLSLLKPRSEISWPIPDTRQPTSETTWLLCVDLSNPTIARDSLVQSTKHRKTKTVFQKASSVTFPQSFKRFNYFRWLFYKCEMHLKYPTPRFDCPRKKLPNLVAHPRNRKWVSSPQWLMWIYPTKIPFITGVITHLLSMVKSWGRPTLGPFPGPGANMAMAKSLEKKYPSKYGILMGFWWDFDGILMGILMGFWWDFDGILMGFWWDFDGILIGFW